MAISENPPTGCDAIERHWGWTERFSLEIWMTNAPINVNPGGGGGSAGKGRGFDAWDYPPVGLLIVRSDPGVGTFDFDRQKPGVLTILQKNPVGVWKA